jgi:hypothetical protein
VARLDLGFETLECAVLGRVNCKQPIRDSLFHEHVNAAAFALHRDEQASPNYKLPTARCYCATRLTRVEEAMSLISRYLVRVLVTRGDEQPYRRECEVCLISMR